MKRKFASIFTALCLCLCLTPMTALAINDAYPYEVTPFRTEDFSPNPGNATYVGSTAPELETREMTINGETEEVSVFPAGTTFRGQGEVSLANTVTYINGEPDYSTYYDPSNPLPAQGVYRIEVYSNYYGFLFGYVWVTAESSDTAEPEPEPGPEQPATVGSFTDVSADAWYAQPVSWAVENGITGGTSETAFSPDATCTTAQIITFLWRAYGSQTPAGSGYFSDVSADDYYNTAAAWAYEQGLVSSSAFGGNIPCTRASTVTYLWKLAGRPAADSASFTDVPADADYAQAVSWAVENGVTGGTGETSFSPDRVCTRGQIVTFLYSALAK